MIKLFFLMIFLFIGAYSLKADEAPGGNDQEFTTKLDNIKNPFEDGIPKPVVIKIAPTVHHRDHKEQVIVRPKARAVALPILLPALNLQGVIVGEDIHQAIINDKIVPLGGSIEGARVDSVTKQGVELFFKGKKFFLKVD